MFFVCFVFLKKKKKSFLSLSCMHFTSFFFFAVFVFEPQLQALLFFKKKKTFLFFFVVVHRSSSVLSFLCVFGQTNKCTVPHKHI